MTSNSSGHQHTSFQKCEDWCAKDMFVKVEANSTVLKNLSSWAMKCSWAYCGGCSACSDPSLELEPPRRKPEAKAQALHAEGNGCEDWCSGDEFEVVHQNTTATKSFSWDMKCDWQYCHSCSQCKDDESRLSLASEKGPFDVLGWFRHDESESAETKARQVLKAAAKKKVLDEQASSVDEDVNESDASGDVEEDADTSDAKVASKSSGKKHNTSERCDDWCGKEMFVKVEANSTVLKNLSSWGMKCSWAYCGGCSACSDPSLEVEPPRRKQGAKGQALHMDEDVCEDWCSGDQFEVVHQNATATKAF